MSVSLSKLPAQAQSSVSLQAEGVLAFLRKLSSFERPVVPAERELAPVAVLSFWEAVEEVPWFVSFCGCAAPAKGFVLSSSGRELAEAVFSKLAA